MTTTDQRYAAWKAWDDATQAFKEAVFPPVGHESPSMEKKRELAEAMQKALAEFMKIDGY
jgi:hypothetical protein